ncbi:MAG: histidine--tRNA ligase [Proteobacteria bacterium]|jgi:histidyl-tRNA synthetase|nr:histidine--tRNA ligase [Pseudomonadota bacterium]
MVNKFQSVKGFYDVLPDRQKLFRFFEKIALDLLDQYDFREIGLPLVEPTGLFVDSVGSFTDIVEKEMYSWKDALNDDQLTLRPEGTAGCVRAVIQNNLTYNGSAKLFYRGAMFRHENVQKGRQRQFHQLGVETFGVSAAAADAEQIIFLDRLWKELKLKNVSLIINSIGDAKDREIYRSRLIEYFEKNINTLDEDAKRRYKSNPMRVLDSKNKDMQEMLNNAPKLSEYLSSEAREHFNELQELLRKNNINFEVNNRLVRGLDYYNRTVFEWITNELGSQGTIAGGGRYDYLVESLGGNPTFACGFAIGIERIVLLLEESDQLTTFSPDIYIVNNGAGAQAFALTVAEKLRGEAYRVSVNLEETSFKSQFKKADKSGAEICLVIGEEEVEKNIIQIKLIREKGDQFSINYFELTKSIKKILN